jgi:hypothetical protein
VHAEEIRTDLGHALVAEIAARHAGRGRGQAARARQGPGTGRAGEAAADEVAQVEGSSAALSQALFLVVWR